MKQPIRILGICLLMLAANLVAQAQGPNSPPLVVRFSGTDTFSFFNDCTGETVVGNIAFAGVLTQTVTNPGGPLEENHFDSHVTVLGTGIGQTTPVAQSVSRELQRIQPGELCVEFWD